MKRTGWLGVFLATILAGLTGCASQGPSKVAAQGPPPTVAISVAAPGEADIFAEYPAQTYARDMVDVRGRVEGYIEKWLFHPGDRKSTRLNSSHVKISYAVFCLK